VFLWCTFELPAANAWETESFGGLGFGLNIMSPIDVAGSSRNEQGLSLHTSAYVSSPDVFPAHFPISTSSYGEQCLRSNT
jgi:hypothetical protein